MKTITTVNELIAGENVIIQCQTCETQQEIKVGLRLGLCQANPEDKIHRRYFSKMIGKFVCPECRQAYRNREGLNGSTRPEKRAWRGKGSFGSRPVGIGKTPEQINEEE